MSLSRRHFSFAFSFAALLLSGCAMSNINGPQTPSLTPKIAGKVHGGQQAISGATIQLYAASATADKGASTPLLTTAVTTDSNGNFSITGDYTCPTSNPLVYLVSTGGNPGLGGSVNNTDIALMTVLGTCKTLNSFTFVVINELSTVVSVQSLAPYMTDYTHVGQAPTNPNALAGAFQQASITYDFSTGQFFNSTSIETSQLLLTTLADILAACVNTSGGAAGSATPCGNLLSLTGTTTDTVTAALHMIQSPSNNTAQLYGLITAGTPFQPYFTTVPTDFTAGVGYTLPPNVFTGKSSGALDSTGQIWLYYAGYSYDTVADKSTDIQGVVTIYDNNFTPIATVPAGTGGLYYPESLTADASGHVFSINSNNTVSKFSSGGGALSPATGWNTGISTTFTGTGPGNGYVDGTSQVSSITVDTIGNIWGDTPFGSTNCYLEMNSSGVVITPSGNFCGKTGGTYFGLSATDGPGNAWFDGQSSISKVDSAGNFAISAPLSQSCFFPISEVIKLAPPANKSYWLSTLAVRYDHVHGQLWGYSETGAGAITDAGGAQFCDVGPTTLPLILPYASTSTTPGDPYTAGSLIITSSVLDGAGNLWFTSSGVAATGTVGTAPGTFTGTVKYSTFLGEISPSGVLLSPYNASTGVYGYQPLGLGVNATASSTNGSISSVASSAALLGVDVHGNIWAVDIQTNKLLKIQNLATANTVNY